MKILGIIPARFSSTRFPAKLLKIVEGKSILQRVYEQCEKTKSLNKIVVATDNETIFEHVESFHGEVVMTSEDHQSGTDRCAEALKIYGGNTSFDYAVNIQGDEPLIDPDSIDSLCTVLDNKIEIASACVKIERIEDLLSPNVVKVVIGEKKQALYFSRSPIPHIRDKKIDNWLKDDTFFKHLGLYAFRTDVLEKLVKFPMAKLEKQEKLEQLRWLSNGFKINMVEVETEGFGIDTEEDFERLKQFLAGK
ncbi:3-deoxy-manno-octulosonate cytidylyltransferase [Lacihabitans sp. LS3-19]|uniref:3-deoxy-manno-octulosonate cytidylyltransferase n=1 Tax=Lacihabitans sp. LS3-19 TaxID=2487335 RepID=UPI0020CEF895|nr:3-deoxy-manno-octulosonate cytidylyltransferase [Lacihabitans sp. LS3-19]MCP9767625.1 3-deoxy-manno-octulosonate cytidylyltransferase [Lacihabitans sp. LS3-19]